MNTSPDSPRSELSVEASLRERIAELETRLEAGDSNRGDGEEHFRALTEDKYKNIQKELCTNQERFQHLLEAAHIITWEMDLQTNQITYVGPDNSTLLGFPLNKWYQKDFWANHIHPLDQEWVVHLCKKEAYRSNFYQFEYRMMDAQGGIRWIHDLMSVISDDAKTPKLLQGFMIDITERKQTEERIASLAGFPEENPNPVLRVSRDHHILYSNQASMPLLKTWGCEIGQELPRQWHRVVLRAFETNQPQEEEVVCGNLTFSLTFAPITQFQTVNIYGHDITERKKLESRIQQAQKMEAIGTLAGGIAHDFNNILMAMLGHTQLTLLKVAGNEVVENNLQHVLTAGYRARDLIQQILAFSRKSEPVRKYFDFLGLMKEILHLIRASLPSTIKIKQHFFSDSGMILGDPVQIHQVMMNICANAEHAMRETGGILNVELNQVDVQHAPHNSMDLPAGPYLRVMVRDTGVGIAQENLSRVFDPFFTTKDVGEGTGMGLAVAHGIIASHGGSITVDSRVGQGTTVTILLPQSPSKESEEISESQLRILPQGKGKILFVDDEESLVKFGKDFLGQAGYQVIVHTNSVEALKVFQADPQFFDAVITDQTMPDLTGEDLAREMLRIRPDIPIIICTGFSYTMTPEKAQTLGIRKYLPKPFNGHQLATILQQILGQAPDTLE